MDRVALFHDVDDFCRRVNRGGSTPDERGAATQG